MAGLAWSTGSEVGNKEGVIRALLHLKGPEGLEQAARKLDRHRSWGLAK